MFVCVWCVGVLVCCGCVARRKKLCRFKTPPYVQSKRLCVCRQNAPRAHDCPVSEEPHDVSSSWAPALEHILKMKIGEKCEEARARRNKPSNRSSTPGVLRQSGDKSKTRTRGTTQSSQCNWAWTSKRMAGFGRKRRQCPERHSPINQWERARGGSADAAENAAGTAGTTRRGASRGLESKPPAWACEAHSELTPTTCWTVQAECHNGAV